MSQRNGRKRLAMDMPIKLHEMLKKEARRHGTTITRYVIGAIIDKMKRELGN